MKPIILSHSADYDGQASAEIAGRYYKGNLDVYPIDYGDDVPWDQLKNRDVIMSDFSLKAPEMSKLCDIAKSVTYLDHHKSAIDELSKCDFWEKMNTLCTDKLAACEIVWSYFFNNKTLPKDESIIPKAIRMLGRYDSWRFDESEKERLFAFQYGLKSMGVTFGSTLWDELLSDMSRTYPIDSFKSHILIQDVIDRGTIVNDYYHDYINIELNKRLGRTISLKVKSKTYRIYAMNAPMTFSESFLNGYDKATHDCCMSYYQNADGTWSYSVYVQGDKTGKISAVDVVRAIHPTNSGGHISASGATTDKLLKELQ